MPRSAFTRKYDRFRTLLVEAREDAGLTQVDVARKLGRPQSFVSKYETGERRLDVIEFLEIAGALKLAPASFLRRLQRQIAKV